MKPCGLKRLLARQACSMELVAEQDTIYAEQRLPTTQQPQAKSNAGTATPLAISTSKSLNA
jgi:hypothetical protein